MGTPRERLRGAVATGTEIAKVARKIGTELRNPKQFLDPERRKRLFLHGRHLTSAIMTTPDKDTENIGSEIAMTLQPYPINGSTLYANEQYYLPAIVFPDDAEIDFISLLETSDTSKPVPKFFVAETTVGRTHDPFPGLPSEGYRKGDAVLVPFTPRSDASRIQHGGFYINTLDQSVEILNYDELEFHLTKPLQPHESLVEANWYMNSENANEVSSRPNLESLNDHNVLGVLIRPDGSVANFSISSYTFSVVDLYNGAGLKAPDIAKQTKTTVRHIAALSNLIAQAEGAQSWAVCGLEYANGGTYLHRRTGSGYFQIRY